MPAVFESQAKFEKYLLNASVNLTKLMTTALLWLVALTLLFLALAGAWLAGVTGTEAAKAIRSAWSANTVQVLLALGFSALSFAAAAWWAAKKLHTWVGIKVVQKYVQEPA